MFLTKKVYVKKTSLVVLIITVKFSCSVCMLYYFNLKHMLNVIF